MKLVFVSKRARMIKLAQARKTGVWKPGDIFLQVTGKSVRDCQTIDEVDAEVGKALDLNTPLKFTSGDSGLVVRNGDVFPHRNTAAGAELDNQIDRVLRVR